MTSEAIVGNSWRRMVSKITECSFSMWRFIVVVNVSSIAVLGKVNLMWTKPEATEMRFGFEVTMYVCNR